MQPSTPRPSARKPRNPPWKSNLGGPPSGPDPKPDHSIWRRYSFAWVTGGFFIISIIGHWLFGWAAYVNEQVADGHPVEFGAYVVEMSRDTFENWQSEFLQLLWQVGGLALLLYVGSPQSKEGDDRMEAKIDEILRRVAPKDAEAVLGEIDESYAGRHTDAPHAERREKRRRENAG